MASYYWLMPSRHEEASRSLNIQFDQSYFIKSQIDKNPRRDCLLLCNHAIARPVLLKRLPGARMRFRIPFEIVLGAPQGSMAGWWLVMFILWFAPSQ